MIIPSVYKMKQTEKRFTVLPKVTQFNLKTMLQKEDKGFAPAPNGIVQKDRPINKPVHAILAMVMIHRGVNSSFKALV